MQIQVNAETQNFEQCLFVWDHFIFLEHCQYLIRYRRPTERLSGLSSQACFARDRETTAGHQSACWDLWFSCGYASSSSSS